MSLMDVFRNFGLVYCRDEADSRFFERSIDTVVVNGTGYEPLLETDRFLLERESRNILQGLEYLIGALDAVKGVIAVNENHSNALTSLQESAENIERIRIFPVGDFYPAGDECVLVYEVTGRIVHEGGIAADAGCMIVDVESVLNVYGAVTDGEPVTRKWLTCAGDVRMPSIVKAHIGAPLEDVLALCGGAGCDDFAVIIGNPLTGRVENDLQAPVEKATSGIIVLPKDHVLVTQKKTPLASVIRRSKSLSRQDTVYTDYCPRYLLGHGIQVESILNRVNYGLADRDESVIRGAFLCGGCGLCDIYNGTLGVEPGVICAALKKMLDGEGYLPVFPKKTPVVHEMREYRKVPNSYVTGRLQLDVYSKIRIRRWVETDPVQVEIPLWQEGVQSRPVVSMGDRVSEKECIARASVNECGADVHASVSGRVTFIDSERIVIVK